MKLFNDLVTVAESTAPAIYVAFFCSTFSCRANLFRTNQSNNKYVRNWNFSLLKFLTNKQLTQNVIPPKHGRAGLTMKLSLCRSGLNSLTFSEGMLLSGADRKTSTTGNSFSVTAGSDIC